MCTSYHDKLTAFFPLKGASPAGRWYIITFGCKYCLVFSTFCLHLHLFHQSAMADSKNYSNMTTVNGHSKFESLPQEVHDEIASGLSPSSISSVTKVSRDCHHKHMDNLFKAVHITSKCYTNSIFWQALVSKIHCNVVKDILVYDLPPKEMVADSKSTITEQSSASVWHHESTHTPELFIAALESYQNGRPATQIHFTKSLVKQIILATKGRYTSEPSMQLAEFVHAMSKLPSPAHLCVDGSDVTSIDIWAPTMKLGACLRELAHWWPGVVSYLHRGEVDVLSKSFPLASSVVVIDGTSLIPEEEGFDVAKRLNFCSNMAHTCQSSDLFVRHSALYTAPQRRKQVFITKVNDEQLRSTLKDIRGFRHHFKMDQKTSVDPERLEYDTYCQLH